MAESIGDVHEVELLDGRTITVRALSIARNRRCLKKLSEELPDPTEENPDPMLTRMLDVFEIAYEGKDELIDLVPTKDEVNATKTGTAAEKKAAQQVLNDKREALEDTIDRDTLKFIIKVTVGFDLDAALEQMVKVMMEEERQAAAALA